MSDCVYRNKLDKELIRFLNDKTHKSSIGEMHSINDQMQLIKKLNNNEFFKRYESDKQRNSHSSLKLHY